PRTASCSAGTRRRSSPERRYLPPGQASSLSRFQLLQALAGRAGNTPRHLGLVLVEAVLAGVDLDEAPALAPGRQADHQQRLEAELFEQRRLGGLGLGIEPRNPLRLARLDDLLGERV